MLEGLLVLILLSNPNVNEDAELFAKRLQAYSDRAVTIQTGKEARKKLGEMVGIDTNDLLAAGTIGKTISAQKKVILVHLDKKSVNGDAILEAKLWYDGRQESYVSIAGNEGDPMPGLVEGSTAMIGYLLRNKPKQGPIKNTVSLSQLAKEKAWEQLLGKIAAVPSDERAPMVYYYQVMAYANLNQRDAAVEALNKFRKKYKSHILITSAESIIPPRQRSQEELINLGGEQTLDPLFEGEDQLTEEPKQPLKPEAKKLDSKNNEQLLTPKEKAPKRKMDKNIVIEEIAK